jgi:pimeloyl-ACP methyl ester carboxylesterase
MTVVRKRKLISELSLAIAAAACATQTGAREAGDLAGAWRGTWSKAGDTIGVTLSIEKTPSGYAGSWGSDDLHFTGIPFSRVETDGTHVVLAWQADFGIPVLDGRRAGGRMSGALTEEDGAKGSFSFARDPSPPPASRAQPVAFTNGDVRLAGDLILPAERGRYPAVVFLHGSGAEGRWANRYRAQQFARRGFAALIYDKRGVGASSGDWRTASFDDFVADAAAGVQLLRTLPEIDPDRIGAWGHSQGGTTAPLLAPVANLRFVIASAASGQSGAETEFYSAGNYILRDLAPAERADAERYLREVIAVAWEGKARTELDAMTAAYRGRSWFFEAPAHYWAQSRAFSAIRPAEMWARVQAPVLLLWGERDERVDPAASMRIITQALAQAGNTRVTTRIFAGAEHTFRMIEPPVPGGWARRAPGLMDTVISWAEDAARR